MSKHSHTSAIFDRAFWSRASSPDHWHITDLNLDCLVNTFTWSRAWPIERPNTDEYWRIMTNMKVVRPSRAPQAYKDIHNNTGKQVTSWANTLIFPPSCDHAFSGRSSSPVLLYVNGQDVFMSMISAVYRMRSVSLINISEVRISLTTENNGDG